MNNSKQKLTPTYGRNSRISQYLVGSSLIWIILWYFVIIGLDLGGDIKTFVQNFIASDYDQMIKIANLLTSLPFAFGAFGISTGLGLLVKNKVAKIFIILAAGVLLSIFFVGIGTFLNFSVNR
jgi:hypothetical protein